MNFAAFAFVVALVASSAATAADLRLTPSPSSGQQITYIEGRPAIVSDKPMGSAAVFLPQEIVGERDLVRLILVAKNLSPAATTLVGENVSAQTDAGPVSVMMMADMEAAERAKIKAEIRSAKWRAFGAALQGAGAAMESSNTGYYTGQANTLGNTTYLSGTYTPPRDTSAEQYAAQQNMREAQSDIASARSSMPQAAAAAAAQGFRPSTIESGQVAVTFMPISRLPKKTTRLTVDVDLNGERHEFAFIVAPYKR